MTPHTITIVGLGLMGTALTERFLQAGFQVHIWNRSPEKAGPLLQLGAAWTSTPFRSGGVVLLSLYNSDVVQEVLTRFDEDLTAGTVIIDTTTGEPAQSQQIARCLVRRNIEYLDAPISGSSEQTRRGEATALVSGSRAEFDRLQTVWPVLGAQVFYIGESGNAAKMKLVTNLVLGLNRAALAEGLAFAAALEIEPALALDVLRNSPAYSRQMDSKGMKMVGQDFSVQARLSQHLKDVRLMLSAAAAAELSLPLSQTHAELLTQAVAAGWGDLDNSAICQVWQRRPK